MNNPGTIVSCIPVLNKVLYHAYYVHSLPILISFLLQTLRTMFRLGVGEENRNCDENRML